MIAPLHVLLVEDSENDALLLERTLRQGGVVIVSQRVDSGDALRAALREHAWDVVIADYVMPGF